MTRHLDLEINVTAAPIDIGDIIFKPKEIEIDGVQITTPIIEIEHVAIGNPKQGKAELEINATTSPINVGNIDFKSKDIEIDGIRVSTPIMEINEVVIGSTAQGPKGIDGVTPYIGENKNWFIGDIDTGIKAEGETISANAFGNFIINNEHTIEANNFSDTISINAGKNINIHTNTDSITIDANDPFYIHDQMTASKKWIIKHNLEKYPSITVVDSADSVVVGDITYTSLNSVEISFAAMFCGKAYFS